MGDEQYAGTSTDGSMFHCSLGLATMRRDGFVSLDGSGEILTRKIRFDDNKKYLFVNASAKSIKAEVLDADEKVIPGFSLEDCIPFSGDSTCTMLKFSGGKDLGSLRGEEFRIRFVVEDGEFYSFWVSDTEDGNSNGYYTGGVVN